MRLDIHFCREFRTKGWVDLRSVVWRTVLDGMGYNAPGYELQWLLVAVCLLLAAVSWLLAPGCRLLAAGCKLLAVGRWLTN